MTHPLKLTTNVLQTSSRLCKLSAAVITTQSALKRKAHDPTSQLQRLLLAGEILDSNATGPSWLLF